MRARRTPDRKKDALAFVVTGAVGVGFAEVAGSDRTVDGSDDLGKLDVVGISGQDIAAADAAFKFDLSSLEKISNYEDKSYYFPDVDDSDDDMPDMTDVYDA